MGIYMSKLDQAVHLGLVHFAASKLDSHKKKEEGRKKGRKAERKGGREGGTMCV